MKIRGLFVLFLTAFVGLHPAAEFAGDEARAAAPMDFMGVALAQALADDAGGVESHEWAAFKERLQTLVMAQRAMPHVPVYLPEDDIRSLTSYVLVANARNAERFHGIFLQNEANLTLRQMLVGPQSYAIEVARVPSVWTDIQDIIPSIPDSMVAAQVEIQARLAALVQQLSIVFLQVVEEEPGLIFVRERLEEVFVGENLLAFMQRVLLSSKVFLEASPEARELLLALVAAAKEVQNLMECVQVCVAERLDPAAPASMLQRLVEFERAAARAADASSETHRALPGLPPTADESRENRAADFDSRRKAARQKNFTDHRGQQDADEDSD